MTFGIGGAVTGFTAGSVVKYIPQYFVVYTFMVINLGIVIFLILWNREPSYVASFLILFGWGACEGIWNSIPPSELNALLCNTPINYCMSNFLKFKHCLTLKTAWLYEFISSIKYESISRNPLLGL